MIEDDITPCYARGPAEALNLLVILHRCVTRLKQAGVRTELLQSRDDLTDFLTACQVVPTYYWTPEMAAVVEQASRSYPLQHGEGSVSEEDVRAHHERTGVKLPVPSYMPRIAAMAAVFGGPTALGMQLGGVWRPFQAVIWLTALSAKRRVVMLQVWGISWGLNDGIDVAAPVFECNDGTGTDDPDEVRVPADASRDDQTAWFDERDRLLRWACTASMFIEQKLLAAPTAVVHPNTLQFIEQQHVTPTCHVVQLRRMESAAASSEPGSEREWSCRWIVRGHWRNQWFPSRACNAPVWILPHVKGPADKPLKPVAPTVYAVTR